MYALDLAGSLPFPRGTTYGRGLVGVNLGNVGTELEGTLWPVYDPEYGFMVLRVVRNSTGSTLNVGKVFLRYSTTAVLRRIAGTANVAGTLCTIADPRSIGLVVPANDLFYVVASGRAVALLPGSTSISIGELVQTNTSGYGVKQAAGNFAVGCALASINNTGTDPVDLPIHVGL